MRRGGSKRKGSAFERWTARTLSQWYFHDPNILIRTQGSGAMSTVRHAAIGLNDLLQVQAHEDPFPFCVECKHLSASVSVHDLARSTSLFQKAWAQTVRAAALVPRVAPLLVFRTNNQPVLVTYPRWVTATFPSIPGIVVWESDGMWLETVALTRWIGALDPQLVRRTVQNWTAVTP